jgi:putative peptide zinc metalloprotease protein
MQTGQALLSGNWYRVAALKPRLRGHTKIHRHVYRDHIWYVVEDKVSGKYHRFNPASYMIIGLLDGRRDMQAIWSQIIATLADQTPSQDEIITLLGQMYSADLIQCDVKPDLAELFQRRDKQRRRLWLSRFANPMSIRIPLFDPDVFLNGIVERLPFLGNYWGMLIWLLVVVPALILVPSHWTALTENFNEQLLTLDNIVFMAVVFPIIKTLHEFGHAIACKVRGGQVHEMGVMILVFFPAPYVDASSASAFVSKWQRMLVGAAGMLTELFVAALAFYSWVLLEPGVTRSLAYNAMVLASFTTLLFNANPLLRYDGYYIFADWLESPNFANRSSQYWQYLIQRYLLTNVLAVPPSFEPSERYWFLAYEPLAFCYRLFLVCSIALFIAQQYFFIGVVIAFWGLVTSILMPIFKGIRSLINGSGSAYSGTRAISLVLSFLFGAVFLLFLLPLPRHTVAEGVLWPPENAILRAESDGFVERVLVSPGEELIKGQPVLITSDPDIQAKYKAQDARVLEVQGQYDAAWGVEPARALQLGDTLRHEKAALERIKDQQQRLTLHSASQGKFLIQDAMDLPGRWLTQGEVVGYVQNNEVPRVRVVVDQDQVDHVRLATRSVEIKLPQTVWQTWSATLIREVPAANHELPSSALGQQGGGDFALNPRDDEGMQTLQSLFEFELMVQDSIPYRYLGSRVYVRFEHPAEPIGFRLWRSIRRLFLSQFVI